MKLSTDTTIHSYAKQNEYSCAFKKLENAVARLLRWIEVEVRGRDSVGVEVSFHSHHPS